MLPLTKCMDLKADLPLLEEELKVVDLHFHKASPQAEQRRWEYAMALRALKEWPHPVVPPHIGFDWIDVGGAGSPLSHMLSSIEHDGMVVVVDPTVKQSLHDWCQNYGIQVDCVFCISVLEHVKDLEEFVQDLAQVTAPEGLLFLTMDIKGDEEPGDSKHFHWLRERIFTPDSWKGLHRIFKSRGFRKLGEVDWSYHDDQLYGGPSGYSFASLAMVKHG